MEYIILFQPWLRCQGKSRFIHALITGFKPGVVRQGEPGLLCGRGSTETDRAFGKNITQTQSNHDLCSL